MKKTNLIIVIFIQLFSCSFLSSFSLYGQEISSPTFKIERPQTQEGKTFETKARSAGQRTRATYLSKQAPIENKKPEPQQQQEKPLGEEIQASKYTAIVILVILLSILLFVALKYRLGDRFFASKNQDHSFADAPSRSGLFSNEAMQQDLSLKDLSKIDDPRKGIHMLMVQALIRAAQQNNIGLRRSLTARDIVRRIPKTWEQRSQLLQLVGHVEVILFGGKDIDHTAYQAAIEHYKPLIDSAMSPFVKKGRTS